MNLSLTWRSLKEEMLWTTETSQRWIKGRQMSAYPQQGRIPLQYPLSVEYIVNLYIKF